MSAVPTFKVCPHPLEIPAALLALAPDAAVTVLQHWFDFAIEEKTNAGQLKSEIEQRMKHQAAGLFSIDEAACIIAGKTGEWPKEARTQIWQAIYDGRITPVSYKTRAILRLPLTGTKERLALVRTNELANVFEAWPIKPETQTAPATNKNESDEPAWIAEAQEQARTIIERQATKDLHPNLEDIADEIAKEWRKRGKFGPKGTPLSGATIKRHALQGHGIAIDRKTIISTSKGWGK